MLKSMQAIRKEAVGVLTIVLAVLSGCASGQVQPVPKLEEVQAQLPKELQTRFQEEVFVETVPTPVPSATPAPTSKKQKKAKGAVSSPAPAVSFKYPNRRPAREAIWVGEKLTYDVTYLGVSAGTITLEVLPFKQINKRKVYHLFGRAVSSKVFSMFYRLDDKIESFMDFEGLFSHKLHMMLDESKQTRDSLELFDSEKKEAFWWLRWNHWQNGYSEKKETHPLEPFPQDGLSALYYVRMVALPQGGVFRFPLVSEGKMWELIATVVKRETVDTPMGEVPAVMIKIQTKFNGVMKQTGDSYVWFTDDDRRLLVKIEAKVKIGTVKAVLDSIDQGQKPET